MSMDFEGQKFGQGITDDVPLFLSSGPHLAHLEDSMVGGYNNLKAHSLISSVVEERNKTYWLVTMC